MSEALFAHTRTAAAALRLVVACGAILLLVACGRGATAAPDSAAAPVRQSGGGASTVQDQPANQPAAADLERIAQDATWAPGSLREHFQKHGREGPYSSADLYDAAARETIRQGTPFHYVDRSTSARRRGYYHAPTNRFTSVTEDGRRITTHFKPDNGERYVRGLPQSTYQ
ncbi:MAG: hypothetical protein AVDCRST_MAG77-4670 [uncultured Chloroflexi bacterium]|uniref:Uncharacterized protein n=1 Tax=uncultured Chloroflexota bacterium TaxID=166587 RepID=A0A6J4JXY1_9CHLR|nr:MAG: hypothetical protein AVDCRST_MAG77-4670 [uncultured Chloroflexota bacterium]